MKTPWTLASGLLAAVGATACCFGPLLLVTIGFGGAWAARMKALEAFQPAFVVLTVGFIGFAFHRLYVQPRRCAPGEACELPRVLARQRVAFWVVVAMVAFIFAFPLFAQYFY